MRVCKATSGEGGSVVGRLTRLLACTSAAVAQISRRSVITVPRLGSRRTSLPHISTTPWPSLPWSRRLQLTWQAFCSRAVTLICDLVKESDMTENAQMKCV